LIRRYGSLAPSVQIFALCVVWLVVSSTEAAPPLIPSDQASDQGEFVTPPRFDVVRSGADGVTLEFELLATGTKDESPGVRRFRSIDNPGGGTTGMLGQTAPATYCRYVALPRGAEATAEVTVLEEEMLRGSTPAFVQHEEPVRIGGAAVLRDLRIAPLVFQPVRYSAERGEVRVARRMRVDIQFHFAGGEKLPESAQAGATLLDSTSPCSTPVWSAAFDPSGRKVPRAVAPSFDALYRRLVVNYDQALQGREIRPGVWVAICPDDSAVISHLAPLLEWRRRMGVPVRMATTAETGATKEAIRAWLRNAWQNWDTPPEYVVLVGDASPPYMIPTWNETLSGQGGEGDHPYTQLESDDVLPDVHIGRLSFNTLTELEVIVAKIVSYESTPFVEDPSWFRRACLAAPAPEFGGGDTGWSSRLLQQWAKVRLLQLGYVEIDTCFSDPLLSGMREAMNRGDGIVSYRGTYRMSGWTNTMTYALTNGWRLPFVVAITCDTGNFLSETSLSEGFLRANMGVGSPRGGIGMIGTATGGTHTRYNNGFQFGVLQGLLYEGQTTLGAALTRGKLEMYANYETTEPENVLIWSYWNNLMGDPATDCWTGFPQPLTVSHAAEIAVGANSAPVTVQSQGAPEPGALVCLWSGGSEQFTATTDTAGQAVVPITASSPGAMKITVTRHDRHPYLATIPVIAQAVHVGFSSFTVDDDSLGESRGNGDGQVNPTETIELRVALENSGSGLAPGVSAILSSSDPYVIVVDSDEQYGDIAPGSAVWSADDFGFTVNGACPNGHPIRFGLDVHTGTSVWRSLIDVPVAGPAFAIEAVQVNDTGGNGLLDPGETGNLVLTLRNTGGMNATGVHSQIVSQSPWVTIIGGAGTFGTITAGQTGTNGPDAFAVASAPEAYRGAPALFRLITASNGGMVDTTTFCIPLGQAATIDPTGPDRYGYFALDDTDVSYSDAPVYQWTEIDPAYGGDGNVLPLDDFELHRDKAITVDLPFTFSFFGRPYIQATICSNGWIAMGPTYLTEYRNWNIPGAGAPENLIAVFWDDLNTGRGTGRILQKYDAAAHRLIIEWSHMINQWTGHPEETFQTVIYDPAYYPTPSGDGIIDCRYRTVANVDQEDGYATMGIQDTDHTDGVLYTYANVYAPGAAPLANGRAVRFYPAMAEPKGMIDGFVTNASWPGASIGDAEVRVIEAGWSGRTDACGRYRAYVPDGVYTVVAGNESFGPDTVSGVVVSLSEPSQIDFSLIDRAGPAISGVTQLVHTPSTGPYTIEAAIMDYSTVAEATLFWRRSGGAWSEAVMTPDGSVYRANIPVGAPGDLIEYYVSAQDGIGWSTTSPSNAPGESHQLQVTALVYAYDVEGPPTGWLIGVPGDDATWSIWARGLPHAEYFEDSGQQVCPGTDHTPAPGVYCFNTGSTPPYFLADGCTTLQTPFFNLRQASGAWFGYYRWYAHVLGSGTYPLMIKASNDGGTAWTLLSSVPESENWWQFEEFRVDDTVPLTDRVAFRFTACMEQGQGYVTASLDDFWIEVLPPDPAQAPGEAARPVFALLPVRPNPNPRGGVSVTFSLERAGRADLAIYDIGGRLVKTLLQDQARSGAQSVFWDGRTDSGVETGAGVFFCRLSAEGRTSVTKIVRIR
jgi:hypothetical protein